MRLSWWTNEASQAMGAVCSHRSPSLSAMALLAEVRDLTLDDLVRSHLRQAGFLEAIDEVVPHIYVAQRLGVEPMVDRKVRVGDQE